MRKLIFIILSCLLISQISLSAQTKMQRSPTPQTTIKTGSSEMEELIMEHWNKQISENKKSKKEKAK